jgi:site-specific recombinase XerD
MRDHTLLGPWVRRFLLEYLVTERNLSLNTQHSYRDTFRLLLPFTASRAGTFVDHLQVVDITPDVVRQFLTHVERERRCSIGTRNQRLAAVHALARFIGEHSPEHVAWCGEIRLIPHKRSTRALISYLTEAEMDGARVPGLRSAAVPIQLRSPCKRGRISSSPGRRYSKSARSHHRQRQEAAHLSIMARDCRPPAPLDREAAWG